jgi:hypothetical protein
MSKSIKAIVLILAVISITGIIYLAYLYFEPTKDIAIQKTDAQLTEQIFINDFIKDHKNADSLYKNKIVELTGKVKKIETQDSVSTLVFDNGGNFIIIANCISSGNNELKQLKEDTNITVKGIYSGYIINDDNFMIPAEIKIDKCTLVK